YALKKNLWGGGMSPGEPFVGTVNFSDTSIDGGDYLDETTYNMFIHLLEGLTAGVPQHFTGDYFGGHRDEIIIESLNDAILELSGTAPLPRRGYGLCHGGRQDTPGFGDPDPRHWGWQPDQDLDFDCLDNFADPLLALGTAPTAFGRAASDNRSTYMQAPELGPHIARDRDVPRPPPVAPVWPLPRRPGGPSDEEIRAAFTSHDAWHYAFEFEGDLCFSSSHRTPLPARGPRRPLQRFRHLMPWLVQ